MLNRSSLRKLAMLTRPEWFPILLSILLAVMAGSPASAEDWYDRLRQADRDSEQRWMRAIDDERHFREEQVRRHELEDRLDEMRRRMDQIERQQELDRLSQPYRDRRW